MPNYDFTASLSPLDFEMLVKDLIEEELSISLENFREGRDKGIDLRYAPRSVAELIVQCKRYSSFGSLKSELKCKELPKIQKLNPKRYILATSVPLSPQQVDELTAVLAPYVQSPSDIFGRDRLNSILAAHPELERRHLKLWVGSAGVLDSLLHAGTHIVSREEAERSIAAAKIYVRNTSFDEALNILKAHRVCIISGLPGIGKTTLARMLLLYFYGKGFDLVKIESDISEARDVGYHRHPRFYYYDDFLGQTAQADKLNKNEDQKLLDFMRSVRESKDSVFVLTTREYILNQARLHYEKLDREKFDHRTCVIDLSKYSRRIRAQILYNHLHFSDLPREHVTNIIATRGYLKIVDHPNYNPRLIEFLTSITWLGDVPSPDYLFHFLQKLNNPVEIWNHAFCNQLSHRARHLLFVLTTLPREVRIGDISRAFDQFHVEECTKYRIHQSSGDFRNALKELDGTFIAIRKVGDSLLVRFQNPSIRDFMQNVLLAGECLAGLLGSVVFFEQAQWFWETLTDEESQLPLTELAQYERSILDVLKDTMDAPSCTISVVGSQKWQIISEDLVSIPARVAAVISALESRGDARDIAFELGRITQIAEQLRSGTLRPSECIKSLQTLRTSALMNRDEGKELRMALKDASTRHISDIDDFETVAAVLEAYPEQFTSAELEGIRNAYTDFAEDYASECLQGELHLEDPEQIREEAYRLSSLDEHLKADTMAAQEDIKDFAKKKEKEVEEERDWDQEDRESASGYSDFCPDRELDSMFGTLK